MPDPWTTRSLIAWIADALASRGLPAPRLSAEILVSHVLGCDRLRLVMDPDRPASAEERAALRDLTARALKHEPVQYLVGRWWFFGTELLVDPRALIPRPETELIVETVLQDARTRPPDAPLLAADIGTGCGAIAIALAAHRPGLRVLATDISDDAIALARSNVQRHALDERVELIRGDLLDPLLQRHARVDYLCSNPPYIPDDQWPAVPEMVRLHEPEIALRGGPDGLAFVRPILHGAPSVLRPGGMVLVEVAETAADTASAIAADAGLRDVRVLRDADRRPRVVVARAQDAA